MQYISSVTKQNKRIYYELDHVEDSTIAIVLLSGFSGSRDFPFLRDMASQFYKKDFSTLRLNFCTDSEDSQRYENALELKDITFSLYEKELSNLLEILNFKKYIFIGHSFGAIVSIHCMFSNPRFLQKSYLIFWEPSLIPWSKEEFLSYYPYDKKSNLFVSRDKSESLNEIFFNEITSINSLDQFKSIASNHFIISAKDSCDKYGKKYFSRIKDKVNSQNIVLDKTDHCFSDINAQNSLFEKTLKYINTTIT